MKIAIVHDWLVVDGGAEKVLRAIIDLYPDADIFALVDFLTSFERQNILNDKQTTTSFLQKMPFAQKYFRNYLPLFPKAIESLDLSHYDLIISSSWAVAKGIKKTKNQWHLSYCHTPIRYAWDLYTEYTANINQPKKWLVQKSLQRIRQWDLKTTQRVDYFIANSHFVASRIKKTYTRDATVIYPPVDTQSFTLNENKEEFYLTASRLVAYKKSKLIVEAFNQMPDKKLVVIGEGEEYRSIKAIAKNNIEVLGYQEKSVLIDCMQRAKAFVYGALEDFGIVPIEALSCGTPVIALSQGGTGETIVDGVNGVHFHNQTKEDIMNAIHQFETMTFDYQKISLDAQTYTTKRFKEEFGAFVNEIINEKSL
ncbi:MAG: glycosyltransferase [Campylobacterales bacterium]|nr:glycosyltransferase [Campylobacterales bacterium]